jgi:Low molecular weight phosphotyrosine protein phosphatase
MRSELLPVRIPDENSIQRSLFLCTGNSARSIMAEAIMRKKGMPNFRAYSAGSHPAGRVHPEALRQIEMTKLPSDGLRSKSWDEFAVPALRNRISFSLSVTTPPEKSAPCGRA